LDGIHGTDDSAVSQKLTAPDHATDLTTGQTASTTFTDPAPAMNWVKETLT
jgi:hypothetical protein